MGDRLGGIETQTADQPNVSLPNHTEPRRFGPVSVMPLITGAVAQFTGSLQAGLVAMSLVSAVGVGAGLMYPVRGTRCA